MTTQLTQPTSTVRPTTVAFALPGLLALAMAIYLVAGGDSPEDLSSTASRLSYTLFGGYLAASAVGAFVAVRAALAPPPTSWLIGAGYGLVLVAVVALNVLAREPWWFLLLAGPGQLLAMVGFGIWVVWGKRRGVFNLGVALLGGVGAVTAIIGSEAGLSVLIAGFWFALAAQHGRGAGVS
jgi:hypothetical protein